MELELIAAFICAIAFIGDVYCFAMGYGVWYLILAILMFLCFCFDIYTYFNPEQ